MSNKNFEGLVESIEKMSVLELSQFVKTLEEKFGVSSAMPMMAASSAPAAVSSDSKKEEKTEFKVTLKESGDKKIDVIKALRKVTTLTLTDAKKAVEEAPTVIAEAASKDDAQKMKAELEAAGAKVELA